jgi:hypothetical protein
MVNFGPPTFYPPIPINEPGNGAQGVTLQTGVPTFVNSNPAAALDVGNRGVPLNTPTVYSPPVNFQQVDDFFV